jgi:hypothetical protein
MKPICTITARVSGPCDSCRKRADVAHLVENEPLVASRCGATISLYCAACCPECRKPRETDGGANLG